MAASRDEFWGKLRHNLALGYVLLIVGLPLCPLLIALTPRSIGQFETAPHQVAVYVDLLRGDAGLVLGAVAVGTAVAGVIFRDYFLAFVAIITALEIPVLRWLVELGALHWILKYA